MENKISIFKNDAFGEVRVAGTSEEPLFCLADVCKALGITNVSQCKTRLNHNGIRMIDLDAITSNDGVIISTLGNSTANFITESNLYKCIFMSRKEEAEQFQDWICEEVLPTIRRTGGYVSETSKFVDIYFNNVDAATKAFLVESLDNNRKLIEEAKIQKRKRIEAENKNAVLMHVRKTYTATEVAKELNLKSAIQLNKILAEKKIQYQSNGTWVFYSKYADCGYEDIKQDVLDNGKVVYHRKFTQLGRDFIVNLIGQ